MKNLSMPLLIMPALLLSFLYDSSQRLYASPIQESKPQTQTPTTYHFDWHISGAPEVAPLQVFDNGQKLYLQFRKGFPTPVILADKPDGQILLHWRVESPYIVLNQLESRLHFRLGRQHAQAWRKNSKLHMATAWPAKTVKTVAPQALFLPTNAAKIPAKTQPESQKPAPTLWQVKRSDENLRQLLTRWAQIESWHLVWDVNHDIPIQAEDQSHSNFKEAVRRVLGSTALTEYQIKPCFYANRVVRVVRKTTVCNPHQ
ncbi:TcpQ domain-containing protein [Mycoavidus sp. B2-EB]|uniref:TcpQ domain-containing protein n=1 Tax=Mycoavidus sp. B2-EB TaxID=2651972 RepID=UPI0016252478|nr:TcpQ domain-containing protein [Mycoavidus sp. B2-EB]BBO59925.1 lipoprotein [Mycoavidus sp. B2-EB]